MPTSPASKWKPWGRRWRTVAKTEQIKKTRQPRSKLYSRLWRYVDSNRPLVVTAVCLQTIRQIADLVCPLLSGLAIDAIGLGKGEADLPKVFTLVAVIVLLRLVKYALLHVGAILNQRISSRVSYSLRRDVFQKLLTLPVSYFDNRQTGDILSVLSYDVDTVKNSLVNNIQVLFSLVLDIAISAIMMALILPELMLVFCVTVPLSIAFAVFISRYVRPFFRARSKTLGKLNGFTEEMISGQKTIRAYGRQEEIVAKYAVQNHEAAEASQKARARGALMGPGMNLINNISLTLISIFGGILYLMKRALLGDVSAFVQYSRRFLEPIRRVGDILGDLQSAFSASERIFDVLDEPTETADAPDAKILTDVAGEVSMEHITFGYTEDKTVISDLSLCAKPGSLVAIVGHTGAGKTTIINLLMRFYDAQKGLIAVDGKGILTLTRDSLRRGYTMVLQDTWLFEGTVFENVAYGKEGVTLQQVEEVCKVAGIHDYVRHLPQGYDTIIRGGGTGISKGQKQMLTIARAMLMDSPMLILDEATSNVDTRTEQKIQSAMRKLMEGRTCFVIAHRLSTIRHADLILVMENGSVQEQGTHEELMAKNGVYAALYHSQFENG
ncbi:MAG: ABC transporter ATP-binding protein [Oscillospiraceae bacterium]|nr:ABC transporter ATP-binding protein [Oscillospiraceae bacterium]